MFEPTKIHKQSRERTTIMNASFHISKCIALFVISIIAFCSITWSNPYHYKIFCGNDMKWDHNTITLYASTVSFSETGSRWPALQDSIEIINENPSRFRFSLGRDSGRLRRGNGDNEIWYSRDPDALDGAPAITWSYYRCSGIHETDIVFDADVMWTHSNRKSENSVYGGVRHASRSAAVHELGHALGLAHTNSEYNCMGSSWTHVYGHGDEAVVYFGEDSSDGAVYLYGETDEPYEDLSVVHWRWTGIDGEYSTHGRTRIFDSAGVELSKVPGVSEVQYYVDNRQTIDVEFTFENNGKNTHEVWISFWLSNNEWIGGGDHNLHQYRQYTLGRNEVYTTIESIELPDDLTPNTEYYFGVVVDGRYDVTEVKEGNNASYIKIKSINFPTPTPTATHTPRPTPTPTPTWYPEIVLPTWTPTPHDPIEFVIEPEWLHMVSMDFEQHTAPIPGTLSIHADPNTGIIPVEKIYQIEGGDYGNSPGVVLPNGMLLTVCRKAENLEPMLILISEDGAITEFAKLEPISLKIGGIQMQTDTIQVMNMAFDGKEKIVLLCNGYGYDQPTKMSTQFNFRTTITGSFFDQTLIKNFRLY